MPGSKSITNRAMILAAAAPGVSTLRHPLQARDTDLMGRALTALGVTLERRGPDLLVTGPGPVLDRPVTIDCGNAGTVARFLPPFAALAGQPVTLTGDARMSARPVGPLLAALRQLGAEVEDQGRAAVPFTITGPAAGLLGGTVEIDASSSSQLVSGLLLAGPRCTRPLTVRHIGPPLPSAPHVAMTVDLLSRAGATVDDSEPDRWHVQPGGLQPLHLTVEPDLSTASAFVAAAAATAGTVTLLDWPARTEQPGRLLPGLLTQMGCATTHTDRGLTVTGPVDGLTGLQADLRAYGEALPTLTALAVLAHTPSRLTGVAHLRLHETDRLAALAEQLGRLGARIDVLDDGLEVTPAPLHGGLLDPQADHRLAMAFAVVGLVVPGVQVLDIATTGKTLPDFPQRWAAMLGH